MILLEITSKSKYVNLLSYKDDISRIVRKDLKEQLEVGGRPGWVPLTKATLKRRRRSPRPFDTIPKDLWNSYIDLGHPSHIESCSNNKFELGSSLPYAEAHQKGAKNIPERPLDISDEAIDEMADVIVEDVADNLMKEITL